MNKKEIWMPIKGYGEVYSISNRGNVRRNIAHLKRMKQKDGYFRISLYRNRNQKNIRIHKLVANTFLGACPYGLEINHKDGNKSNNHCSNLEYVTRSANIIHAIKKGLLKHPHGENHGMSKLKEKDIVSIRKEWRAGGVTQPQLAKMYKISIHNIYAIIHYKIWKHIK